MSEFKPTVLMIELPGGRWRIVATESGAIIQDDIKVRDAFVARDYIANWVTSFGAWSFELRPLKKVD